MVLETSSGIFTVLETYSGDFFGGIFTVLETSGIFTVLESSLEGFSRCWRLLGFSRYWRLLLEILMVPETSSEDFFGRIFMVLEA